jgi:hypothetical protein
MKFGEDGFWRGAVKLGEERGHVEENCHEEEDVISKL